MPLQAGWAVGQLVYQRHEVASLPVRLPSRPGFLAGREEFLARLDAELTGGGAHDRGPRVIVLCGLGGVGKTSVAVEYAHRQLPSLRLAWHFAADSPATLAAGFRDLAAMLGVLDPVAGGDPVAAVHGALAVRPDGWLLIFDNAPDASAVAGVLPPAGDGQVLITTQDPRWAAPVSEVQVLDAEVAAAFLLARSGDGTPGAKGAAGELARELGGLPLALEQAAAYIQAVGRGMASYLSLFRERRAELLDRGDPAGYDKRVATTWSLAFTRLEPGAAGLLRLLACCAPESVPLDFILQPRPWLPGFLPGMVSAVLGPLMTDPLAADDALAGLRRYSLTGPPCGGAVSVHRLVQAVTLAQIPGHEARAWRYGAAILIAAAVPADPQSPAAWPAYAALLPHAVTALGRISPVLARAAEYVGYSGSFAAARELFRQIADARQQALGADHLATLDARAQVSFWTGQAGDPAAARDQMAALLPARERVLGAEAPNILTSRANLARWTGLAGDPAAAREQYAALLHARERVCGADHPDTLTDRGNLAYWTGLAGDPAAARNEYAVLVPACSRIRGAEHPETLTIRANLARWTGEAGDVVAACDQYTALLPVIARVLGADHPTALAARGCFAAMAGITGDWTGARDQFAALAAASARVYGPMHPETLLCRCNLAEATGLAGNPPAARDAYGALLPAVEQSMGAEHPTVLAAKVGHARWIRKSGDPAAARDMTAALMPVIDRVCGAGHPIALAARDASVGGHSDAPG